MSDLDQLDGLDAPGIFAKVSATLDVLTHASRTTHQAARRALDLLDQAGQLYPSPGRLAASTITPAANTNPVVLDLGGPSQGRVWEVRNLVVGGALPTTVVAGRADVFVSGAGASQQPNSLLDWRDYASTLPNAALYGAGDLALIYPENLFVVLTGYTVSTQYLALAGITDRLDSPAARPVSNT